jgi:hypothetical protein
LELTCIPSSVEVLRGTCFHSLEDRWGFGWLTLGVHSSTISNDDQLRRGTQESWNTGPVTGCSIPRPNRWSDEGANLRLDMSQQTILAQGRGVVWRLAAQTPQDWCLVQHCAEFCQIHERMFWTRKLTFQI